MPGQPTEPVSQVTEQLSNLETQISKVETLTERVLSRFSPVIRPGCVNAEVPSELTEEALCQHADILRSFANRLKDQARTLGEISDFSEL